MTRKQLEDRKDLVLLEKYIAAHKRLGTSPATETLTRYAELRARFADATRVAA